MSTASHWLQTATLPSFPRLNQDLSVDVAIVGGGITGITAAYLLRKAGQKVALLERGRCAHVNTGHTTAHLTYVTDTRLGELARTFGKEGARAAWEAGRTAIDTIESIAEAEQIDCLFMRVPGYLHTPWKEPAGREVQTLQDEAKLAKELGFDCAYETQVRLADRPGIRFPNQALFHPLRYLQGLLAWLGGKNCPIFENSMVTEFKNTPLSVVANGHTVRCKYLIVATHATLTGMNNALGAALLQTKLAAYSTYAVGARLPQGAAPLGLYWDTTDPYYYLRIHREEDHDYAILGGEDHKTGQDNQPEACYQRLTTLLNSILPDAGVDTRWMGQVIEPVDGLPYIGELADKQFIATGYAGNGMTFGTIAGLMAADAVLQRPNPYKELFAVNRKKLSAVWEYLKENIDYPYYLIKDRLTGSEGVSVQELKLGQGKILTLNGKKVAVYRDEQGELTQLSPQCTHMGCVVHWNQTESTWDCPCHGSRFHPTGEVIDGPAQSPLTVITPEVSQKA